MVSETMLDDLSGDEQIELLELLEEEENYRKTHQLFEYHPYGKQREFIDAGHQYTERCFMAGNQLGKSYSGGAEVAFHLTGRYPALKAIQMMVLMVVIGAASVSMSLSYSGSVVKLTRQ